MSDPMEAVLVTGGAGSSGSHLVDALLKDGRRDMVEDGRRRLGR